MSSSPIIYLEGVSSSGKTTLTKHLQCELKQPFLHMRIGELARTLPPRIRCDEVAYRKYYPVMEQAFHILIKLRAQDAKNLIVEHFHRPRGLNLTLHVLKNIDVLFVGLHCPFAELERRELERGDSRPGLARSQLGFVHRTATYDLELDTSKLSPEECAARVIDHIQQSTGPRAFERMRQEREAQRRDLADSGPKPRFA